MVDSGAPLRKQYAAPGDTYDAPTTYKSGEITLEWALRIHLTLNADDDWKLTYLGVHT